jgi:hypothetical protein
LGGLRAGRHAWEVGLFVFFGLACFGFRFLTGLQRGCAFRRRLSPTDLTWSSSLWLVLLLLQKCREDAIVAGPCQGDCDFLRVTCRAEQKLRTECDRGKLIEQFSEMAGLVGARLRVFLSRA